MKHRGDLDVSPGTLEILEWRHVARELNDILAAWQTPWGGVTLVLHREGIEVSELVCGGEKLVPGLRVVVMEENDGGEGVVVVDDVGEVDHCFIAFVDGDGKRC